MIIKLLVEFLQVVQGGPPVFIFTSLSVLAVLDLGSFTQKHKLWSVGYPKKEVLLQMLVWCVSRRFWKPRTFDLIMFLRNISNSEYFTWYLSLWFWLRQILYIRLLKMMPSGIISLHLSYCEVWKHLFCEPHVTISMYRKSKGHVHYVIPSFF